MYQIVWVFKLSLCDVNFWSFFLRKGILARMGVSLCAPSPGFPPLFYSILLIFQVQLGLRCEVLL